MEIKDKDILRASIDCNHPNHEVGIRNLMNDGYRISGSDRDILHLSKVRDIKNE